MKILVAMLALAPVITFAAATMTPFDGTWKAKLDATHFSKKPDVFDVTNGKYTCSSFVPAIAIKANGTDQAVTGHDYYDTVSVKVLNKNSLRIVRNKAVKVIYEGTNTVSADGNTLDHKFSDLSGPQEATGEFTFKRIAPGPAGSHAASGSWQYDKILAMSDSGATFKFVSFSHGLKMTSMTGQSYNARFDGKDVPLEGDPAQTTVSLQKIGPRDVEETDKRGGKTIDVYDINISADGKTMTYTDHDMVHQRTDVLTYEKQP